MIKWKNRKNINCSLWCACNLMSSSKYENSKTLAQLFRFPCWSSNCKLVSAIDSCEYVRILVSCFEYELPHYSVFHPREHFTGWKYLQSQRVWIRESPLYPFVVDSCFQHASRCCQHFVWISSVTWTSRHKKKSHLCHCSQWGILGGLIYYYTNISIWFTDFFFLGFSSSGF